MVKCGVRMEKIGYLSSASGSMQAWEMNPDGSNPTQITDIEGGINAFSYAPDMSKIYYLKEVQLEKSVADLHPDLPKANARVINDMNYRHWDSWVDTYTHIFIADYREKITSGTDIMPGEKWSAPVKPLEEPSRLFGLPIQKHLLTFRAKSKGWNMPNQPTPTSIFMI